MSRGGPSFSRHSINKICRSKVLADFCSVGLFGLQSSSEFFWRGGLNTAERTLRIGRGLHSAYWACEAVEIGSPEGTSRFHRRAQGGFPGKQRPTLAKTFGQLCERFANWPVRPEFCSLSELDQNNVRGVGYSRKQRYSRKSVWPALSGGHEFCWWSRLRYFTWAGFLQSMIPNRSRKTNNFYGVTPHRRMECVYGFQEFLDELRTPGGTQPGSG